MRKAQAELAHVTRVTTMGELVPRLLTKSTSRSPRSSITPVPVCVGSRLHNLDEARQSAALIIADGHRAGEIISRIRALTKKAPPQKDWLEHQ